MDKIRRLLLENKAWAQGKLQLDPDFFSNMAKDQKPDYLWIGCSDSRVDPNELTHTQPGEMFVHRNVANLVIHTDLNLMSVIQYAVDTLLVEHIIVCGHYNCGGIRASFTPSLPGMIDRWIGNIRNTHEKHLTEMCGITDHEIKVNRLVEINVMEQVQNLAELPTVQNAWKTRDKELLLHGWIYDLNNGRINSIATVSSPEGLIALRPAFSDKRI